jgi:hypothetical protein
VIEPGHDAWVVGDETFVGFEFEARAAEEIRALVGSAPKGVPMCARVVRFTDVDPDHLAGRLDEVEAREGPPVDIPAKSVQILHDPDQRTAVVIQIFETADDMSAAEGALDAMDPGDTPGTRASIDRCEIKAEVGPG